MKLLPSLTMERRRFLGLAIGIWVLAANGSTFAFALYSDNFKQRFNLTQEQLNTVLLCGTIGQNFGLPAGYIFDKVGPMVLLFGAVLTNIGWLLLYFAYSGVLGVSRSVPALSFYYFVAMFATCFSDTGGLLSNMLNFKRDMAAVVTIAKSFTGLGAAIYTAYYNAFFYPSISAFLLFCAITNPIIFTIAGVVIPPFVKELPVADQKRLRIGYVMIAIAILFMSGISVYQAVGEGEDGGKHKISHQAYTAFGWVTLLIMTLFFLMPSIRGNESDSFALLTSEVNQSIASYTHFGDLSRHQTRGSRKRFIVHNSTSLWENLKTLELWCMLWVSFAVVGGGSVVVFNAAQIYKALDTKDFTKRSNSVYVSVMGIGSALGRIVVGCLLNRVPHSTILYNAAPILVTIAYLMLAFLPVGAMGVSFFLASFTVGASWSAMVVVCTDIFGPLHLGMHYNFCTFGCLLSSYFLNVLLFAKHYDNVGKKHPDWGNECYGRECVQLSFYVLLGLGASAIPAAIFVHIRGKQRTEEEALYNSSLPSTPHVRSRIASNSIL